MINCGIQKRTKCELSNNKLTVQEFYSTWYMDAVTKTKRRKVPCSRTLAQRSVVVRRFVDLIGDIPLDQVTEDTLILFEELLKTTTYQRSPNGPERQLSEVTQRRHLEEIEIVLKAAGPKQGKFVRAGILEESPAVYREKLVHFPKSTWAQDEARAIVKAASEFTPNRFWRGSVDQYRALARVQIGLWYFTGHRATTYQQLKYEDVHEGFLHIKRSVKTGKPDRLSIHPQLLELINDARPYSETLIANWPMQYRAISEHHTDWQRAAGLFENRIRSVQSWRRFHAQMVLETGFKSVMEVTSQTLGHSSSTVTTGHYANPRDMALMALPNIFDRA